MSLAIVVIFSQPVGFRFPAEERLLEELETVERIAADAGLKGLEAFADDREIPEDFEGGPDDFRAAFGAFDKWFDPVDGAKAVEALASAASASDESELAMSLRSLEKTLRRGAEQGVRFHLDIG